MGFYKYLSIFFYININSFYKLDYLIKEIKNLNKKYLFY
jgi:hypothetical protein